MYCRSIIAGRAALLELKSEAEEFFKVDQVLDIKIALKFYTIWIGGIVFHVTQLHLIIGGFVSDFGGLVERGRQLHFIGIAFRWAWMRRLGVVFVLLKEILVIDYRFDT